MGSEFETRCEKIEMMNFHSGQLHVRITSNVVGAIKVTIVSSGVFKFFNLFKATIWNSYKSLQYTSSNI